MDDKRTADRSALNLFVKQDYGTALVAFRAFQQRPDLEDLDRAKTHFNIATCLFELHLRRQAPADWQNQFVREMDAYLRQLEKTPLEKLAPDRLKDCFNLVLRFHLEVSPVEDIAQRARDSYRAFAERTGSKVTNDDYLQVAVSLMERERRNFSRADHAQRATKLAEAVLGELGDDDRYRNHRAAIYNLLADLAYFFPLSSETDNERYRRVNGYLERALQASSQDDFARTFKRHIDLFASRTLQVKRFGHDTKNRLANLRQLLGRLQAQARGEGEMQQTILAMQREIRAVSLLGRLIEREQPARGDWQQVDPAELVRPLLQERGWPDACLQRVGEPEPWLLCPDYVRIALENLLRNTTEAYGRRHIEPPEQPCRITIDYRARTISVRDWAGGVDTSLGDVFEPYVSSKGVRTDTGLGLSQARIALDVQDPSFNIALSPEQPPQGAEFRLHFPVPQ